MTKGFYDPLLQELYEASRQLSRFLHASDDPYSFSSARKSRPQQLRDEADEIEAKERGDKAVPRCVGCAGTLNR